jgi:beta-N-acetylhexosaminidase
LYHTYGTGLAIRNLATKGTTAAWLAIDSIVNDAMARKAFPGAVVMAVHNGEIKYHKAFGNYEFDKKSLPVNLESIYDVASVTKISATTVAIMKLYEQGKLELDQPIGKYLPFTRGTNKENLTVRNILLHQAGLFLLFLFTGKPSIRLQECLPPHFIALLWILLFCTGSP